MSLILPFSKQVFAPALMQLFNAIFLKALPPTPTKLLLYANYQSDNIINNLLFVAAVLTIMKNCN